MILLFCWDFSLFEKCFKTKSIKLIPSHFLFILSKHFFSLQILTSQPTTRLVQLSHLAHLILQKGNSSGFSFSTEWSSGEIELKLKTILSFQIRELGSSHWRMAVWTWMPRNTRTICVELVFVCNRNSLMFVFHWNFWIVNFVIFLLPALVRKQWSYKV